MITMIFRCCRMYLTRCDPLRCRCVPALTRTNLHSCHGGPWAVQFRSTGALRKLRQRCS